MVSKMHLVPMKGSKYDVILGRDILTQLGIVVNFREQLLQWDDLEIPMPDPSTLMNTTKDLFSMTGEWKDASYDEEANVEDYIPKHLPREQQDQLLNTLLQYPDVINGELGCLRIDPSDIELKPGVTPCYQRPYPIPVAQ